MFRFLGLSDKLAFSGQPRYAEILFNISILIVLIPKFSFGISDTHSDSADSVSAILSRPPLSKA